MNSEQIKAFLTVSSCLSFTTASEILFLSQPTISRQVRQLEEELGCSLFLRGNNYLRLTPKGKILAAFFQETGEAFAAKLKLINAMDDDAQNCLNIGFLGGTIDNEYFFKKIDIFQALYPRCKLQYRHMEESSFLENLIKGEVDCVFIREYMLQTSKSIVSHKFRDVNMYLFYSKRHLLAGKEDLDIRDFDGDILWCSIASNTQKRDELVQAIQAYYGIQDWKAQVGSSLEEVLLNVRIGNGIFIADDNLMEQIPPDFCRIPLDTPISNIGIYVVEKSSTDKVLLPVLMKCLLSDPSLS